MILTTEKDFSEAHNDSKDLRTKNFTEEILSRSEGPPKKAVLPSDIGTDYNFKHKIVWFNAIGFLILHIGAIYAYYLCLSGNYKGCTVLYSLILTYICGEGITIGAHRMYSHKSFKATPSLKAFLLLFSTISGQNCLWVWVRDHRQHHKYSDTDADPHNANRGFFFSHIGWLMTRKHPKVIEYGKDIDMSDLEADKMVMFQKKYYKTLYVIFSLIIPVLIPVYFWNENILTSFLIAFLGRTILQLNVTWLVNSAAHLYGYRPFDKTLKPVESVLVSFLSSGEGWHNYHHTFPWDYRAAELGMIFNPTAHYIDFLARLGFIYDRKSTSTKTMEQRLIRTGDGTYSHIENNGYGNSVSHLISKHYIAKRNANAKCKELEKDDKKGMKMYFSFKEIVDDLRLFNE